MATKIFISFRFSDGKEIKDELVDLFDESTEVINRSEDVDRSQMSENIIQEYKVKAPDHEVAIGSLSGGNQQKVVVAREVDRGEKLIIFDQPTRGLDLGAINYVHKTIMREKSKGKSILLVSTELSEIFALSDRIAILYKGKVMGIFQNGELSTEQIGLLMAGYELKEA